MRDTSMPLYSKIAYGVSAVGLLALLVIWAMKISGVYVFLFDMPTDILMSHIALYTFLVIISACIVNLIKKVPYGRVYMLIIVMVGLPTLVILGDLALSDGVSIIHEYTSDDGNHVIVVDEKSFLLAGGGTIYEKTSFCTMEKVGEYGTDDGFRPFTSKAFYFVWNEEDFELHYAFFGPRDKEYQVIKMDYAK